VPFPPASTVPVASVAPVLILVMVRLVFCAVAESHELGSIDIDNCISLRVSVCVQAITSSPDVASFCKPPLSTGAEKAEPPLRTSEDVAGLVSASELSEPV